MPSPTQLLAMRRVIRTSIDLEVELKTLKSGSPLIEILRRVRGNAVDALDKLWQVNLFNEEGIKAAIELQNELVNYDAFVTVMREIIIEGQVADQELSSEEREDMLNILMQTQEGQEEARELGLIDELPREDG